jgi:hypothetical protein
MPTADANGGKAGVDVTIDAANLPCALTKVKQNVAPSGEFNEEIILEIQRNSREKLRISHVTANWGGVFVSLRFWNAEADGVFHPSRRGLNIRRDNIKAVADAMLAVLK